MQLLDRFVKFLSKRDLVELLQHRFVEPFADTVGLWASGFGLGVIDVLECHVKLELVMLAITAIFSATVGKDGSSDSSARGQQ